MKRIAHKESPIGLIDGTFFINEEKFLPKSYRKKKKKKKIAVGSDYST